MCETLSVCNLKGLFPMLHLEEGRELLHLFQAMKLCIPVPGFCTFFHAGVTWEISEEQ